MQQENLQMVLRDLVHEQQLNTKSINDLIAAVNILSQMVNTLKEAKAGQNQEPQSPTPPVLNEIKKDLTFVKLAVSAKPKNVIKKWQILLFPEQDAKLFYKIVFGRWFMWLVTMLILTYFYKLSVHWIDNRKEIQQQQIENDRIKKAWDHIYLRQNKMMKRLMDSTYTR